MRKSRLSWYKQSKLIGLFVAGAKARTAAALTGVNKDDSGVLLSPSKRADLSAQRAYGNALW